MNGHPIGTRVRIVRSVLGFTGKLATVVGELRQEFCIDSNCFRWGQVIDIDGLGDTDPATNCYYFGPPDWLEPIRDDWDTDATPNAVASWAGGVWAPERVRV
jgi:hypothetical protein